MMVLGEHGIGKTSLLPGDRPQHGSSTRTRVRVFIDVQGLQVVGNKPGAISQSLFDYIITKICGGSHHNKPVYDLLKLRTGQSDSDRIKTQLARGIDPRMSFATALEELVTRLNDKTKGEIDRMAFLIDEFDRFIEFYVKGRRRRSNSSCGGCVIRYGPETHRVSLGRLWTAPRFHRQLPEGDVRQHRAEDNQDVRLDDGP